MRINSCLFHVTRGLHPWGILVYKGSVSDAGRWGPQQQWESGQIWWEDWLLHTGVESPLRASIPATSATLYRGPLSKHCNDWGEIGIYTTHHHTWLLRTFSAIDAFWWPITWHTNSFTPCALPESFILILLPQTSLEDIFQYCSFQVLDHRDQLWTTVHKSM